MSETDKITAQRIAEILDALPEAKKERLLGYADGVADMQRIQNAERDEQEEGSEET